MHSRLSNLLTVLATLIIVPLALTSSNQDFPIGINLGTDYITAAYLTGPNDFVTVASVETTQAWKNFCRSLLRIDKTHEYTKSEANDLFSATLISIHEATKTKLNREIEILGITYTHYIYNEGYIRNLLDAGIQVLPGCKDGTHAWPYLHSVRKGYYLDNAKALGYPEGTNIDLEGSLLLHIDYQNNVLRVSITSIGTDITYEEDNFQIVKFGGSNQVASAKALEHFATKLKALIKYELSKHLSSPTQLSEFRRVVFSGDAPSSEFQKIRQTVIEAIPDFSDRFIENGLDPSWAGAVGAARLARKHKLNPEAFQIEEQIIGTEHDEL